VNAPHKALAFFFYEQCAGATSGHMSMVPNNPVLFSLIKTFTSSNNAHYAADKAEFARILHAIADDLVEK